MNNVNRLPEWRYDIRRFIVFGTLAVVCFALVSLVIDTLGVDICAEDICYAPFVQE